jgi:hypothetical protein
MGRIIVIPVVGIVMMRMVIIDVIGSREAMIMPGVVGIPLGKITLLSAAAVMMMMIVVPQEPVPVLIVLVGIQQQIQV